MWWQSIEKAKVKIFGIGVKIVGIIPKKTLKKESQNLGKIKTSFALNVKIRKVKGIALNSSFAFIFLV